MKKRQKMDGSEKKNTMNLCCWFLLKKENGRKCKDYFLYLSFFFQFGKIWREINKIFTFILFFLGTQSTNLFYIHFISFLLLVSFQFFYYYYFFAKTQKLGVHNFMFFYYFTKYKLILHLFLFFSLTLVYFQFFYYYFFAKIQKLGVSNFMFILRYC